MWTCPQCGESNGDGNTSCFHCKYQVINEKTAKRICPKCGSVYPPGTRNCLECGRTLDVYRPNKRVTDGQPLRCPACKSDRVLVQAVTEQKGGYFYSYSTTRTRSFSIGDTSHRGTTGFLGNFSDTSAYAVCQSCGNHWKL